YSKLSGKQFVFTDHVKGRVTIAAPGKVHLDEAFNLLSLALAHQGYAISEQGSVNVISTARNLQRSFIPVVRKLPKLQPEKMVTYVRSLKHIKAESISKKVRMLSSRDGEMSIGPHNELIFTDWISNLHRVENLLKELDEPQTKK
ncbi:MAG: general secretion pathway protein GspD, partial [Bdellovibrionales bacterium]|nr:general secretion pathway protein GspD [Bdellovibrionales bacterium]